MNQHQLSVEAQFRPEVLERILRVVRHRGFRITAMTVVEGAGAEKINIEMTVASHRPVGLLSVQLAKLTDITHVQVH